MRKFIIISGGGTGGHIYPAIAIANALKESDPTIQLRFVGAKGKMEMEKIPQAGYPIDGIWISGIQRRLTWKNIVFPIKVISSIIQCVKLIRRYKPNVVVGVGGYASGPLLLVASFFRIPIVIQEQNSYAGLTNKWLAKRAKKICVAYEGMEKFFAKRKLVLTGNPVRQDIVDLKNKREKAIQFFQLDSSKPILLAIGGSLGARTINESIAEGIKALEEKNIQLIWQTGKAYREKTQSIQSNLCRIHPFIQEMDYAYAAADIIIARAGALSISEIAIVGKPVILVPSPHVTADHQTKNALELVKKEAAILIHDAEAKKKLIHTAITLMDQEDEKNKLSEHIKLFAKPYAAQTIAEEIIKLLS